MRQAPGAQLLARQALGPHLERAAGVTHHSCISLSFDVDRRRSQ
jgi:hypothetical protein